MSLAVRFEDRKFTKTLFFPGVFFRVDKCSWDLYGGPNRAEVTAIGPAARLWALMQLLRCGVTISDDSGAPAWWGYVHEVDISAQPGGLSVFSSMDDVNTQTAVRYRDDRPADSVNYGWQWQTAWSSNSYAVSEWGTKQGIYNLQVANASEATAYAAAQLAKLKSPFLNAKQSKEKIVSARLKLRGWWDTLGWMYFAEARGQSAYLSGGATMAFGNAAATAVYAQSLHASGSGTWSAAALWLKVGKFAFPGDNIYAFLAANNAGVPGATLASVTLAASTLDGDGTAWKKFTFGTPYTVTGGTFYWVGMSRSGAVDAANYFTISVDRGAGFAGETAVVFNGGWIACNPQISIPVGLVGQDSTSNQIVTMGAASGCGQFLKGVFIKDASGVNGRLYRSGIGKALDEIRALLDTGTSTGERLTAQVTAERWLVVRKPAAVTAAVDYQLLPSGELRNAGGGPVSLGQLIVGKWARVVAMDQVGGDANIARTVLITRAEWSGGVVKVNWE